MKIKAFGSLMLAIFLGTVIFATSCNMMDYRATVYGYVLSDPDYRDPVPGVTVILRVTSADDVPDYNTITDDNGYYSINFEVGFKDENGHFIPNELVNVMLTFQYGGATYSITDLRVSAGSMVMAPVVYLSQFGAGGGGGGK